MSLRLARDSAHGPNAGHGSVKSGWSVGRCGMNRRARAVGSVVRRRCAFPRSVAGRSIAAPWRRLTASTGPRCRRVDSRGARHDSFRMATFRESAPAFFFRACSRVPSHRRPHPMFRMSRSATASRRGLLGFAARICEKARRPGAAPSIRSLRVQSVSRAIDRFPTYNPTLQTYPIKVVGGMGAKSLVYNDLRHSPL